MNGRDHDVYEEEMKDIRGHHQQYLQQQPYHQDQQYQQQYHQNQPYLQSHQDPHAISTDNLMMPERLSAIASPRGRRPAYPGAHDSMSSAYGWNAESIPATPADSRSTTPTLSPYNNDFNNSRSYLSTTTLVNKNPHRNSGHLSTSTFPSKHSLGEDSITRLNERDDVELSKGWRRFIFKFVPFLALTNTGLYLAYLGLRIACVILAQRKFGIIYPGAWVFLAVEIVVAIPSQMHNFWTMWALKKRNRPQLRLNSEEVPGVDVFVTCCGEDDDVVLDTVRAACDLDYPRDKYRVVVLDDGKAASLEESVNQLGYVYPNLYYMARTKVKGVPHHFKAGNLNYGLEQLDLLPGGANEFMAALDADMIPEPSWLRAILPHMVLDPKLALACPPQLFYNTPVSDPLAQSLNFFVHVIEPIKDALGVAWCTGSGYVIRREALTEIGNFPLGSLAEDVATSTLMLGRGWKTAYIHEPLQFGTVPEDYGGHLKQRTRWAIGTIQTAFKLNFCLFGKDVKMMTGAQRFSGALYAILGMFTILVTISLFAIPVVLVWGKPLIAFADLEQLRWLIRACFAAFMCNRFCEFALFSPAGYHTGQRDSRYQLWMSPYISLSIIRSFILPKWLGGSIVAFKPTGSLGNALNERDPKNKKNMFRRIWAILFNYMAVFHFVFVYFTLVAVVLTSYRVFFPEGQSVRDIFIGLITHAFWPPLTFLFLCSSLWTPVSYAIDPPQMPEREELLVRDQKTGVAHPTTASKKVAFGGQAAWFEFLYTGSTIYTALVFAYSFFL